MKRLIKTKIGTRVIHPTGNNVHQFQGQRSKVKVTRPTNAEIGSTLIISSEREGLRTSSLVHRRSTNTEKRRDLQGQRSRSQGHVIRLTCVGLAHKSRMKSSQNIKVVKKVAHLTGITSTGFEVKRSKVNVTRPINAETESVSPANFKLSRRLENALSTAIAIAIKPCEVGLLHVGGGIPCRPHPRRRRHTTC